MIVFRVKEKIVHSLKGLSNLFANILPPGGVGELGYKRDGGGGPTEPNILHPKKYMDLILCTQKITRLEIIRIMVSDLAGTLA